MVVLAQPAALDGFPLVKTCRLTNNFFAQVPIIDLASPDAKSLVVKACQEFGFFKVVNHGVPTNFISKLEGEAINFFNLTQSDKAKAGTPSPYGYGIKAIGPNGDIGWVEYLLLSANPQFISQISRSIFPEHPETFSCAITSYISAVRKMACQVLEMVAQGLNIEQRNVLSRLLEDEKSDSCFRLNHYPPCPSELRALSGRNLIGFGEHTDPQIISALRSNNTAGLQIFLSDGTWLSVPPDDNSFFIIVGDSLQVMTNGRFKSVKHRVLAESTKARMSMIYFGGPPPCEKIAPLPSLMEDGEESLYKEFTWWEYKEAAYKSRLGVNRLCLFERSTTS
ncbi:hypothetical protein Nepgr_003326 [Nepenthes gracilis]|uniref:gibberellin 2beta-dioxygenase n=1 Tax=Nepenthes gracilis TaxID=150966 RepID=A0AAD3RZF4_NEPGR|nr:hypothetical protein Nepgr_003326 [Nepenthes gracilis]